MERSLFEEMWQATRGKTAVQGGEKVRKRLYPISLDSAQGRTVISQLVAEDTVESVLFGINESKNTGFLQWVVAHYQTILTRAQLKFIEDVINDNEGAYSRSARSHFRKRIQDRLKSRYLGKGALNIPVHRLSEYRATIDMLDTLISAGDDNEAFTNELLRRLDNELIEGIVFDRCCVKTREHVIHRYKSSNHAIPVAHLGEIYEILLNEQERLRKLDLH